MFASNDLIVIILLKVIVTVLLINVISFQQISSLTPCYF